MGVRAMIAKESSRDPAILDCLGPAAPA